LPTVDGGTWEWVENPTDEDARAEAYDASIKFVPADEYKADYSEKTVSFKVTIKKASAGVSSDVDMDEDNVITPDRDDETLNDVLSEDDFSVPGDLEWTVTDKDGNVTHPNGDTKLDDIDGDITWTFTPDDSDNYNVIKGSVEDDDYSWLAPIIGGIIASTSKKFKDVPVNAWYAKAVDFVVGRGLFNGVSDTEFNPDGSMTRAMLVTVLWRLEGEPVVGYQNSFRDVAAGSWYYDAVTWASSEGIVNGYDAYTFGPNNLITREQMATILYRYAQMRNFNTDFRANLSKYADNGSISGYAREAMSWAVGTGIITGMTETTLNPAGTATRAQVATILMRFIRWYSL